MFKKSIFTLIIAVVTLAESATAFSFDLDTEIKEYNTKAKEHYRALVKEHNNAPDYKSKKRYQQATDSLKHGDYFQFKDISKLPQNLHWQSGSPQPIIGDSKAQKGGLTRFSSHKPTTLRRFGPNSNSTTRALFYDNLALPLCFKHPVTKNYMPCLAKAWAISDDKKTVYYKLNPRARYSDGKKVSSIDFVANIILTSHSFSHAPYYQQYFLHQYKGFTLYDNILAVHLVERKTDPLYHTSIQPAPTHFYANFNQNFTTEYDNNIEPTTGAYTHNKILSTDFKIVLSKVDSWWAKDFPQFKYAYNVDQIEYFFLRSDQPDPIAMGLIDINDSVVPQSSIFTSDYAKKGYINIFKFHNESPEFPYGFYLNTAKDSLADKNVRLALQHALNVDKAILNLPHAHRLNQFSEGFGDYTNCKITARTFSQKKIEEYLTKAGLTTNYEGTWLQKNGEPLSFVVSYLDADYYTKYMKTIQSEAKIHGIDIKLEALKSDVLYMRSLQKETELYWGAWAVTGNTPTYYQFFHSSQAYHLDKTLKKQTNNVNSYANQELDTLIDSYRECFEPKKHLMLAHQIQQHIHDSAIFIPSHKYKYKIIASSRWVKWPDSKTTKFSPKNVFSPCEYYLWWVDQDVKKETLKAIQQKKSFQAVLKDTYPLN